MSDSETNNMPEKITEQSPAIPDTVGEPRERAGLSGEFEAVASLFLDEAHEVDDPDPRTMSALPVEEGDERDWVDAAVQAQASDGPIFAEGEPMNDACGVAETDDDDEIITAALASAEVASVPVEARDDQEESFDAGESDPSDVDPTNELPDLEVAALLEADASEDPDAPGEAIGDDGDAGDGEPGEDGTARTMPFDAVVPEWNSGPAASRISGAASVADTGSLAWGSRTDVGMVRDHNEDSYVIQFPLFAVCDGMGGHAAGEVASTIAVSTLAMGAPSSADPAALAALIESANHAVLEAPANGRGRLGMGTTCTAVYIQGDVMAVGHVGDSRCYLLHDGELSRVTHDHSFVEELVEAGQITPEEARVHPNRSTITRALGSDPNMHADSFTVEVVPGDRVMLCSDGLNSMVPDAQIRDALGTARSPQAAADVLVDLALMAGGHDNVTCIVVDVKPAQGNVNPLVKRIPAITMVVLALAALLLVATIVLSAYASHSWYLVDSNGYVALYQGIPNTPWASFTNNLVEKSDVATRDLNEALAERLTGGLAFDSEDDARQALADMHSMAHRPHAATTDTAVDGPSATDTAADAPSTGDATATDAPSTGDAPMTDTTAADEAPVAGGDAAQAPAEGA